MKKTTPRNSAFSLSRLLACLLCLLSLLLALLGISGPFGTKSLAQGAGNAVANSVQVGASYHNDVSPPLREMPAWSESDLRRGAEQEANENPKVPYRHVDSFDPVVQNSHVTGFGFPGVNIPVPIRPSTAFLFPAWAATAPRLTRTEPWDQRSMCKSSTKVIKSLIRPPAIQFWDPIAFLLFGADLAVSAKAAERAIRSCSMIIWPIAG